MVNTCTKLKLNDETMAPTAGSFKTHSIMVTYFGNGPSIRANGAKVNFFKKHQVTRRPRIKPTHERRYRSIK